VIWPFLVMMQAAAPVEPDRAVVEAPRERKSVLVGNALGIALGRLSVDFGAFVAPHVVPTASVHVQASVMFPKEEVYGAGGELGARLYTSEWKPKGAFIGVYAVGGRYVAKHGVNESESSIISYGGAFDVGWSFCSRSNVVVALGAGAELRGAQESPRTHNDLAKTFLSAGVHPRGLVQVGAFF